MKLNICSLVAVLLYHLCLAHQLTAEEIATNSILITGCNRGLGLGLVKQLLAASEPIKHIFATCRNPAQAQELNDLKAKHSNLYVFALDVTNYTSFDGLVRQIDAIVKEEGLNVLINNAGVSSKASDLASTQDYHIRDMFETNTIAPIMLTKAFIPLLKKASKFNENKAMGVQRAAIINFSSIMGSIQYSHHGDRYTSYRISKAGLNMATKLMSIDLKDDSILCVAIHPGWVQTDMGGTRADMTVEDSCKQMTQTFQALNASHSGTLIQYDGKPLPW